RGTRHQVMRPAARGGYEPALEAVFGMRVRGVEYSAGPARLVEQLPERGTPVEPLVEALVALQTRRRLVREVDTVLARSDSRVDGRPGRNVELIGSGLEPPPTALLQQRLDVGQEACLGPGVQRRSVAHFQTDDDEPRGEPCFPGHSGPPSDENDRGSQDADGRQHVEVDG